MGGSPEETIVSIDRHRGDPDLRELGVAERDRIDAERRLVLGPSSDAELDHEAEVTLRVVGQ